MTPSVASPVPGRSSRTTLPPSTRTSACRSPSSLTTVPPRISKEASAILEPDVLGALPEDQPPEFGQRVRPLDDGREVVACQLAHAAREERPAVGKEDLRLAESARVEEQVSGRRVAGVVLEPDSELA